MKTKRIVVTGAPGSGKTSVVNRLEKSGFTCLHEVIRDMTLEAQEKGDLALSASNPIAAVSDPMLFNRNILAGRIRQFEKAAEIKKPLTFFDRAIPDVLAYMDFFNQKYEDDFINACTTNVYDKVFLLPPWKEIYISDNERFESYEEATQLHDHLSQTYRRFGYDLVEVPFGTIKERMDFILNSLDAATP